MFFSVLLSNLNLQFEGLVRAVVFCNVPEQFKGLVNAFYSQAFQAYQSMNKKENGQMDTSGMLELMIIIMYIVFHLTYLVVHPYIRCASDKHLTSDLSPRSALIRGLKNI